MNDVPELLVAGQYYGGWKTLRATRSIEQCSGTFDLSVSERFEDAVDRPVMPGHLGQLLLADQPIITGFIDDVEPAFDETSHELRVAGRGKTQDLVDCSAIHKTGQWRNVTLERIARDICEPFGIAVRTECDTGKAFSSFAINGDGETAFEAIERAARMKAVLVVSDPGGGLVLTRASDRLVDVALIEGVNMKTGRATFSQRERYSEYKVTGQPKLGPDGDVEGASASVTVKDDRITRYRPLIVHAEAHETGASFRDRAEWERNVREGRGNRGSVTVQGWTMPDGIVWQPNTLVHVRSQRLRLDAPMLIVSCTWSKAEEQGTLTELSIARPEAFQLVSGIAVSRLNKKINDKLQREKKKRGDDWSGL